MPKDEVPDPERAAHAARLREQINKIEGGSPETRPSTEQEAAQGSPSPRDFIRQRMRVLDRKT